MRWRGREQSSNVEDRRGMKPAAAMGGGGLLIVILALAMKFMGVDPRVQQAVNQGAQRIQERQASVEGGAGGGIKDDWNEFVSVTLKDTETVWTKLFQQVPAVDYQEPTLVMFTSVTSTGCGPGQAAMGPFYCPADRCVYLDPTFFNDLANRHSAPGDFANAYVIAHEVAHHVQNLLGDNQRLQQIRRSGNQTESNRGSVRLELQADFLAGVWAHHAVRKLGTIEDGDLEEALNAAAQIGDDTLQRMTKGHVDVRKFTHGSSAQRVRWFREGLLSGDFSRKDELWTRDYDEL